MTMSDTKIGIVGAGSFGTAMAVHLSKKGYPITMWSYEVQVAKDIQQLRENKTYLPGFILSNNISGTNNLKDAVAGMKIVLQANPAQATRKVMGDAIPYLDPGAIIVNCTKGLENSTLQTMSELLHEILPPANAERLAFLSGPSFAREVASGVPTAVTIASKNPEAARFCQDVFSNERFRAYTTDDIVGSELASALKNVIAVAAGISDGMGFGHNTLAAIITRGVAEILRLGKKMGAQEMTFLGLSGMGDLVLTCTGNLSRNRSVGIQLGQGKKIDDILRDMKMVAEGVFTAKAAWALSQKHQVDMPITEQVYRIVFEGKDPKIAMADLMSRSFKTEQ